MRQTKPERKQRVTPRRSRPERITPIVLPARPGDEAETVIERIVPGGFGLGYGGGRTLFVSRAAPGDRLRVRIDREHGRVAHASIVDDPRTRSRPRRRSRIPSSPAAAPISSTCATTPSSPPRAA